MVNHYIALVPPAYTDINIHYTNFLANLSLKKTCKRQLEIHSSKYINNSSQNVTCINFKWPVEEKDQL